MNFRWTIRRLHEWGLSRRKLRGGFLHSRLGDRFLARETWIPSRESLARAFLVGMPITMIPLLPLQSVFACPLALWARANLPVTIFLQFLSTPLTAVIHLPICYLTGRLLLGADLSAEWDQVWADPMGIVSRGSLGALYLGAVVLGPVLGALGYFLTHLIWKAQPPRPRKAAAVVPKGQENAA